MRGRHRVAATTFDVDHAAMTLQQLTSTLVGLTKLIDQDIEDAVSKRIMAERSHRVWRQIGFE